jgi:hypothetical protein
VVLVLDVVVCDVVKEALVLVRVVVCVVVCDVLVDVVFVDGVPV